MPESENKEGSGSEGKTRQLSDHRRKYLEKSGNIKYKMLHQTHPSTLALV